MKCIFYFNGQPIIVDTQDICFLESYNRKVSVVIGTEKMRITARLNDEEQRLFEYQFARINQGNIINMQKIRSITRDAVLMGNGEVLYISINRKKIFIERYEMYAKENHVSI